VPHVPSSRDEAPAYLLRYERRRASGSDSGGWADTDEPVFMARARARAAERALMETARPDSPPGATEAYARVTVSPREIVPPESFRDRMAGSVDVRLIRHGETQGYSADGGLTPLGHWQAHRKGQDLARGVKNGMTIRFPHAPTARAQQTAESVRAGLLQALARYGIEAEVLEPHPAPLFRNFKVWCDGTEQDVTQAFLHYVTVMEDFERNGQGERPGWLVEMDRFWNVQAGGGDPITSWLRVPMHFFEPPAIVVRRFWEGIVEEVGKGPSDQRVFVCTHSGPIRAVATAAVGHDPGEPYNTEDVRIRVFPSLRHAIVTYRGRGLEVEIPTHVKPSWVG